MMSKRPTADQIKKCVFVQPYRRRGPDQFLREKPYICIDSPKPQPQQAYAEPVIEAENSMPLSDVPQRSLVKVYFYDQTAVDPCEEGGRFEEGDLLGYYEDAQLRCDQALEENGFHVLVRHLG